MPAAAQRAAQDTEQVARSVGFGVEGGVGLDPELVDFGAHARFGPLFHPGVEFRPGIEFGLGEVTTFFGINLDVLYTLPGATGAARWRPYIGVGPTLGLSHQGFSTTDTTHVDVGGTGTTTTTTGTATAGSTTTATTTDTPNRFDFSDTDFNGGVNFIAGARNNDGLFFELRTTAYGVSNIRLIAGVTF